MLARKESAIVEEYNETSSSELGGPNAAANINTYGDHRMAENNQTKAYQQTDSYSRVPSPGIPTYTEAWALIEAARRMASSSDYADLNDITDRNKVRDSIRLNWRLWTIFQAEMSADESEEGMPDEIRTNMLTLCKFIDEHTVETLKSPEPEKIRTLIEINRNIAAGLLESLKTLETDTNSVGEGTEEAEAPVTNISTSV